MPALQANHETAITAFIEELTASVPLSRVELEKRRETFSQQTRDRLKLLGPDAFLSEGMAAQEFSTLHEWKAFWSSIENDPIGLIERARKDLERFRAIGSSLRCAAARRLVQFLERSGHADLAVSFLRAWLTAAPHGEGKLYYKMIRRLARPQKD